MTKIKNFVANIPIYAGMYIRMASDALFVLGFKLHITFKTESGKKLQEIDEAMKKIAAQVEKMGQGATIKKASGDARYSKLANIIKGSGDGSNSNS